MKLAVALVLALGLGAQTPPAIPATAESPKPEGPSAPLLRNEGHPMAVAFACTEDDMQWAGMSCSEDQPCPVYLELSAIETVGARIILLGNIHSESTTLYSLLITSEDGGATWHEPNERMRGTGLDHIQVIDFQNGWISGETLVPVSRDPFFLITSDGGKSWRLRPVLAEGMPGAIQQSHFESATNGVMTVDHMQSAESSRYELYETPNGGATWMIRRTSDKPIALTRADAGSAGWRIRADAKSKSFAIEKLEGEKWVAIASFLVEIGACKAAPRVLSPPPEPESQSPAAPASPPSLNKPRPKP